jgi:diacylglycerol kinase (ATP)
MRWTAVVNPSAGRRHARTRVARVTDALATSGLDIAVHVSADRDDARGAATRAFDDGRGVVACGGDGTVGELAGLAADHDGLLGIVPTGSGNDFARALGIPRGDPAAAVALLEHGNMERVDLGRAETADGTRVWFATVANTGFDSEANRWANGITWTSGTALYVLATLRTLATYRPRPMRVTVDGKPDEIDAWLVAVGNTRSYAGGMMITPMATLDDGLLDVCVVGPVSRAGFLRTFPGVFTGRHVQHPLVEQRRGGVVLVESLDDAPGRPPLELWASGERVGPLPARVTPAAAALRVVVPTGARVGRAVT